MSKILLFSDIHIHLHKNQISRLEDCLKVLEWVFLTAKSRGIKDIIFAGDLFQDRQKIQVISYEKTFNAINKFCKEDPDLRLYVLVGNHDMWYSERWDVSSVSPLAAIDNVEVVSEPRTLKIAGHDIDFLPYTKNPVADIENYFPKKNDVLISHCSVNGATLNAMYNTRAEVSVEFEGDMVKVDAKAFSGWKKVFLGHFHCAQKLNDIVEYIGSPLELNFGEAAQQKHIIVFDPATLDAEYVVNDFSPKHLIIKESEIDQHDLAGNFVQVVVDDLTVTDIIDMKKTVKGRGCSTLELREKKKSKTVSEEERKDMKEKFDFSGGRALEDWMKAREEHVKNGNLDPELLLSLGQDLIRKASC